VLFCDRMRPDYVGIKAEQFQELLVHEFRRQLREHNLNWPTCTLSSQGVPKIPFLTPHASRLTPHASRPIRPAAGCWSISSWTSPLPSTTTGRTRWRCVRGCRYRSRIPERREKVRF